MKLYTTIVALLMITKRTTGCDTMLNNLYSPEGGILNFSFSVTVPSGVANYQVSKQGGGSILIFGCNAGNIIPGSLIKDSDVDITGNLANGDISFSLKNVVSEDGSNYTVTDLGTGTVILCVTAYVGGELVAALPNVDPVEKDSSVTLTCNTTSTTKPSDLGITYVWTYGSVNVTSLIGRFSFLGNTFTISKIKQTDDKKVVTCTAQEAVSGLTAISNPISIIYKGTTTMTTSTTITSTTTPATTSISKSMTSTSLTSDTTPTSLASTARNADPDSTTRTTTADSFSTISSAATTTTSAGTSASATIDVTSTKTTSLSYKSDKDVITMIIVVSVIGGILVLAVLTLILSWVHWNKCSLKKYCLKKGFPSSDYTKKKGHHERHNSGGIVSTTQIEDRMKDYYLYTGKINPVYDGTVVTSYIYSNVETFHNPQHTEQYPRGAYKYDFNWKQMNML